MEITLRTQEINRRGDYVTTNSTKLTSMKEAIDNLISAKSALKDGQFVGLSINGELTDEQVGKVNALLNQIDMQLDTRDQKFYFTRRRSVNAVFDL